MVKWLQGIRKTAKVKRQTTDIVDRRPMTGKDCRRSTTFHISRLAFHVCLLTLHSFTPQTVSRVHKCCSKSLPTYRRQGHKKNQPAR